MAQRRLCTCDYCRYPLIVAEPDEYGFDRFMATVRRDYASHTVRLRVRGREELGCRLTPPNLFGFAQIRSGCVNPEGGYVAWYWHRRDVEEFLARHGLAAAYRDGGIDKVLREIGLTRMQAEAFLLHVGMGLKQEDVGALLGIKQGAVSLRLKGARERLRRWQKGYRKRNLIILELVRPIDERQTTPFFLPAS
jgi:predicted DNA-binding protein (UPF0251 family)